MNPHSQTLATQPTREHNHARYDALNRLTQKSYSDGTTPAATFTYDVSSVGGLTITNPVGRLVQASTACSSTTSKYDPMGRITYQLQYPYTCVTAFTPFYVPYAYDLAGNMTSASNGYFNTYSYAYNSAGRLTSLTSSLSDAQDPPNLLSAAHYNALGQVTSDTLGDGETESYSYNKRGWRQSYTASLNSTNVYSFNIGTFAPNGDILAANDSANGNWTYTYNPFNRLVGSNKNSGQSVFNYVYDRFGNHWQQNGPNSFLATFTGNNPGNPQNNNRMDGYSYDAAGNLLNDGTHSYTYDTENRIIKVDGGNTATYTYNANGYRVRRTGAISCSPDGILHYVYDLSGRWIVSVNSGFTQCAYEAFAGNRHLASYGGAMKFSHSDWLGTERVRTTYAGVTCESISSLPFGDGQTTSGSCYNSSKLHFTGKERDSESGLDNFGPRYFGSSMGRFMSPDPLAGHTEDPQTLNRYVYVRNNPLNLTDPTGLDFYLQCNNSDHSGCTQVQTDPNNNKSQQWVQADKDGNATIITSDSIRAGDNIANVNENGVTVNGSQGIYFDNPASHTTDANGNDVNHNSIDLAGSGKLQDFNFHIDGNCNGSCQSSGEWSYHGSLNAARALLDDRGSFRVWGPLEDIRAGFGFGQHPYSTQHRFGGPENSPHLSVPYDPNGTLDPRNNVPATGGFHVDAHGDWLGISHAQDVVNKNP